MIRLGLAVGVLAFLLANVRADDPPPPDKPDKPDKPVKPAKEDKKDPTKEDYREFFKTPENIREYWDAMQFELEVGRPDLAARHLHELLKLATDDKELVALEEKVGSTAFLRLRILPKWSDDRKLEEQARKDADELSARVTTALQKVLGNRETILRHIKELSGDREERTYATVQLQRARDLAIPTLVEQLQVSKGEDHEAIMRLLPRLLPETVPPLIAALDIPDNNLRMDLIAVLTQRGAREVVPFLWRFAGNRDYPEVLRNQARQALAVLTRTEPGKLTPAPIALTREAERYYRHQAPVDNVVIWRWDPTAKQLVKGLPGPEPQTPSRVEEYYGLRFAREALDIEPTYAPAQQVFLALALEKGMERAGGLDQPLPKNVRELLASVNPDLVNQVLDRALTEDRPLLILGAVRALGDLAETRALKPTGHGEPALVRAVSYPDRRVQFAAADALLRIPAAPSPNAAGRVVDVLARFAALDPQPKAKPVVLIGFADDAIAEAVAQALRQVRFGTGKQEIRFDVEKLPTGRAILERLKKSADVDALLIDTQLPDPGLPYLLAQLRADPAFAGLPVWLVTPWDTQESLRQRQDQVEIALHSFRLQRRMLQEERARTESLYINSKGTAATPYKVRLERIDRELAERYQQKNEDALLAERKAVERLLLSAPPARELALRRLVEHYRHTWIMAESVARDPTFLKRALTQPLADAAGTLTEPERKNYAEQSLSWLARIAKGEVNGYDFTPAEDALYKALLSSGLDEKAVKDAIEATARLPVARGGDKPQTELARVVVDPQRKPAVRLAAAVELQRRIQRASPALNRGEVAKLQEVRLAPGTDEKLREAVTLVIGSLRPDSRLTGERLKDFDPRPAKEEKPKEEKPQEEKPKPEKP
jgi:hypothetical protein